MGTVKGGAVQSIRLWKRQRNADWGIESFAACGLYEERRSGSGRKHGVCQPHSGRRRLVVSEGPPGNACHTQQAVCVLIPFELGPDVKPIYIFVSYFNRSMMEAPLLLAKLSVADRRNLAGRCHHYGNRHAPSLPPSVLPAFRLPRLRLAFNFDLGQFHRWTNERFLNCRTNADDREGRLYVSQWIAIQSSLC